jgi:hypothetical protein
MRHLHRAASGAGSAKKVFSLESPAEKMHPPSVNAVAYKLHSYFYRL